MAGIVSGPIVNILRPEQQPRMREPADIPDLPVFGIIEVGRGDGTHSRSDKIPISRPAAMCLRDQLTALLEGGGE